MKLILCKHCKDVVKLKHQKTSCDCGKCWGWYVDDLNAVINKEAIPIGLANSSLINAIRFRPEFGQGSKFEAFVIPKDCETIEVVDE